MTKTAVILGYSGHAFVVLDILMQNEYGLVGYCESHEKEDTPFNLQYLGSEGDKAIVQALSGHSFFLGIGSNRVRSAVFESLVKQGCAFPVLSHPKAIVSSLAQIGHGSVIMPGVVINALAKIGNAAICNSSCVIEHECVIGNYAHIAPGAVLAGNVSVGDHSFVGANAVVKQGVKIGSNVTIGAGAVVIKDVADGLTVYGNPAKNKL